MKPWGHLDWLLPWYSDRNWTVITGVGFEPRCTALMEHVANSTFHVERAIALRIDDPESEFTPEIDELTDKNKQSFQNFLPSMEFERAPLLVTAQHWKQFAESLCSTPNLSILLDITTLPKRVGLFLLQQFLRDPDVRDIVVCYVGAGGYKEGHFVLNERPAIPMDGFGLLSEEKKDTALFVSVGYSTFDLKQVLQQTSALNIHFLVPFPPASPSFRRTWKFLKILNEDIPDPQPPISRFHSLDMFALHDWLVGHLDPRKTTTMLPLGPKPHGIAMALAQMGHQRISKLVYPQPQCYDPGYSEGIQRTPDGRPAISAYGLRRDHHDKVSC